MREELCVRDSSDLLLPPVPSGGDGLKQSDTTPVEHDRSFLHTYESSDTELGLNISSSRMVLRNALKDIPSAANKGQCLGLRLYGGHPELDLDVGTDQFAQWSSPRWGDCRGLVSPVDGPTGLPIPILLTDPPFRNANTQLVDYHHLFHPKVDYLQGTDADIALRRSFGQDLPRWLHEHNHGHFAGPPLPAMRAEKFAIVVLACAGVVPRQAIEFTKRGPFHRAHLSDSEYAQVVASVRHEGVQPVSSARFYRNQIGMFFANYALEQSIESTLSCAVIDEFLNTKDSLRRKTLGNLMLREAVALSTDPIRPLHAQAREEGLIRRKATDLRSLVGDFFLRSRRKDYFAALDSKFKAA